MHLQKILLFPTPGNQKIEREFSKMGLRKLTGLKVLSGCKNTLYAVFHAHAHLSFLLLLPLLYFECVCGEKQNDHQRSYLLSIYNLPAAVLSAFRGYLTEPTQLPEGATVISLVWRWRQRAANSASTRDQALNHCTLLSCLSTHFCKKYLWSTHYVARWDVGDLSPQISLSLRGASSCAGLRRRKRVQSASEVHPP